MDFKRKLIDLTKTKNDNPRIVPLNSIALAAMTSQRGRKTIKQSDLVFPLPGPSTDHRWWFTPALDEAGITEYSWHNNRHTFCSWCAMAGISLKEIRVLAGHKRIEMSARYALSRRMRWLLPSAWFQQQPQ